MFIQIENIQIRDFRLTDVDALVKYANNFNIARFMRDSFPYPYKEENANDWISFVKKNEFNLSFAIANETELIGGIGALPQTDVHRFTAEVGFWLGEPFWNKRIISKILPAFCSYLFSKYNFNRLTANVFEENTASKKVLEKSGFKLEGIQRKNVFKEKSFFDQYIYGLLKEDFNHAR